MLFSGRWPRPQSCRKISSRVYLPNALGSRRHTSGVKTIMHGWKSSPKKILALIIDVNDPDTRILGCEISHWQIRRFAAYDLERISRRAYWDLTSVLYRAWNLGRMILTAFSRMRVEYRFSAGTGLYLSLSTVTELAVAVGSKMFGPTVVMGGSLDRVST